MTESDPTIQGDAYHQRLLVPFDYPVLFAHNVFEAANPLLAGVLDRRQERRRHRVAVYVDAGLSAARPALMDQIKEYFHSRAEQLELASPPQLVLGGEEAKNGWQVVRDVMWTLGNLHLDRQSFVLAVGGGAMLDMVGFATSLVHRGLRLVRAPSTVLAQNDAGVGVKTGMDEHGQKNFVGTFAPPFAVINDLAMLDSLADRDWIGGCSEAFKVALIKDADFFNWLYDHADALARRDQAAMEHLVRRTAILHLEHIATAGDPFEMGSARPLDFGHWAGHKIETISRFRVAHGQAVAIGIAIDLVYAMSKGLLSRIELERAMEAMSACGLPLWDECLDERTPDGERAVLAGLEEFREHLGGRLTVTLPNGIGQKVEVHEMNPELLAEAVEQLKARSLIDP